VSLEEVLLVARESLGAGASDVRLTVDPGIPDVRADAAQLERAFANLLENARRYSGGQQVVVHIRHSDARVLVRVVDRGPGIDPSERERIFEPFYRLAATRESGRGSGLGLALVREIARRHGGEAVCLAAEGGGSRFRIDLPAQ
jgi:two-component system sensor histidine kinase KdpD